jgi:hypothetical protein
MSSPITPPSAAPPAQRPEGGLVRRLALLAAFLGLIATIWYLRTPPAESAGDMVALTPDERTTALANYGFYLEEVAKKCGVDFQHQAPSRLDPRLDHIQPIVAAMGASVSVVDFNKDGWPDLFVVDSGEGSKCRLYQNMKDGTFKDVAADVGLADLNQDGVGVCMGAVWGDYDGDGYEDVLVYRWGKPELFRNVAGGPAGRRFEPVGDQAGLPKWINANSALWVDFDRDGRLDLFIAGYWPDDVDLWHLKNTRMMPESFSYAFNGGRKYLLRNRGDGAFDDVTKKMGITSTRWTLGVAAADLCGSGYPDLFLANDYGVSELYANQQGKGFLEIGEKCGVGSHPKSGMNVTFGDIDNNGSLSVYVSNITEPNNLVQNNNLWTPVRGKTGTDVRYLNQANALGVDRGGWSWGTQFADLNNDGRLDLYLVNGYVSADRKKTYWYDYSLIAGANSEIIADAKTWPAMNGASLAGYQPKCLWLNSGGKFIDVARAVGVRDSFDGRAVAVADLWNRGCLDVVVANQKGPLLIYKNTVAPDNRWVQFELTGSNSNTTAVGAEVRVFWNKGEQRQVVAGGNGYASQNQRRLHFGLGKDAAVDKAVIRWPDGREQTIQRPAINTLHHVIEEAQ